MPNLYSVLCVCTSAGKSSWGSETGIWLEEVAIPYYVLRDAGLNVTSSSLFF
jgi:hypothetical protein